MIRKKVRQQQATQQQEQRIFPVILAGMNADHSDELLMQQYRAGDLHAFKVLYQRHSGGLYRFIAWRSPRREWVDEIVQDSWAALHEARSRYEPTASFRTWLYQIARNRLIDLLRHKEALLASDLGSRQTGDDEDGDAFEHLADRTASVSSPEAELEQKQTHDALHRAIRELPAEQREALVLQQFNALSIEEIAVITMVTGETVKSRLRYAMQKLRSRLGAPTMQGERA